MAEEMNENFVLELSSVPEDQVISIQHLCSQIFSRNDFVDCTLCCADGQLQAHRVILASTSNYMYNMLSTTPWPTPCSHPMLFFKAFSTSDMKLALQFIYTGKATVPKSKVPCLMNIARELGCSNLSKAIERAVQSCGVALFRKRLLTIPGAKNLQNANTNITISSQSLTAAVKKSMQQAAGIIPLARTNEDNNEVEPLVGNDDDSNEYDGQINYRDEIKIEPGENMMLELDPSSIVATTIDSTSQQSSSEFSAHTNEESSISQDVKLGHATGEEIHEEIESVIGEKDHVSTQRSEDTIYHLDDMDDDQNEDDEEMPITVVDFKSLAETEQQDNILDMSSMGIDINAETPANCPWCFQVFTSLILLQRHIKTHVGKYKPYSCQYCPASFARTAHLKRHIRTHTGEKPFVCTYCNRAFSRQDKLKTHLERHLLDQHLQNSANLSASSNIMNMSQSNNVSLMRPLLSNQVVKPASSISIPSASTAGLHCSTPQQNQMIQSLSTSTNVSIAPSASAGYQYFLKNDGNDNWQSQAADRISKGMIGPPGQITISTTAISPSTTITPIPPLMVHTTLNSNLQP